MPAQKATGDPADVPPSARAGAGHGVRRHPAVRGALVHIAAACALLAGIVIAIAWAGRGLPASFAPLLMGAYVVVTSAAMLWGVLVAVRRQARRSVAARVTAPPVPAAPSHEP